MAAVSSPPADAASGDPFADLLLRVPHAWRAGLRERLEALAPPADDELRDVLTTLQRLGADDEVMAAAVMMMAGAEAAAAPTPAIAALCEGAGAAGQVWELHAARDERGASEGLRRLLLALVRDLRVVLLLLSRQLAALRRAAALEPPERRLLARRARDILAPLANRLGIWQIKWELEDLAFRHLEPDRYHHIARLLDEKRVDREAYVAEVCAVLRADLQRHGIDADVAGRSKHIYSIWRKMQRKHKTLDGLHDLRAVRVLVDDVASCYAVLGHVHARWTPLPGEFDDYIARPKHNDYRSLHTAVIGPDGRTLEVQIRTRAMHAEAELGIAAHWRYKEGSAADAAMDRRIAWMRRLLDASAENGEALRPEIEAELAEDHIHVITPRGDVLELAAGATPLDFAYRVHTEVGHRCRGAKVDGRLVPLTTPLASGDRVEIVLGKEAAPRRDWLLAGSGFLASARAREKVRNWFNRLDRERNLQAGRELLERELRRQGKAQADCSGLAARLNLSSHDELLVQLALGDLSPVQVVRQLREPVVAAAASPALGAASRTPAAAGQGRFTVQGVDNLLTHAARCCQPLPGDAVAGFLTRLRGVSVHRAQCPDYLRLAERMPEQTVAVEWAGAALPGQVRLSVFSRMRKGLGRELSDLASSQEARTLAVSTQTLPEQRMQTLLHLQLRDAAHLQRLMRRLEAVDGVESVRRA